MSLDHGQGLGVILSSGGGRGVFAHTGFMLALQELNIDVSACAGSSAGAIVGGIVASGADLAGWAEALLHVRTRDFWQPYSKWQLIWQVGLHKGRGLTGLSRTTAAIDFLRSQLGAQCIEDCRMPLNIVAMNLGTGEKTYFEHGPLAPRMMASAAMPGLYEPVKLNGEYFTDGAILELAPVEPVCCKHGLKTLLVHHVAQRDYSTTELESSFDAPWPMLNILQRLIFRRRPWYATGEPLSVVACPGGCGAEIVVIEPQLPELTWPDVQRAGEIIALSKAHALVQLRAMLAQ